MFCFVLFYSVCSNDHFSFLPSSSQFCSILNRRTEQIVRRVLYSVTIQIIISNLLGPSYSFSTQMLNTDPAHANGKTDGKEKETGSSPLDSTTGSSLDSFLRPFSLAAEALNEFGSQRIAPEQYIFLDDLKCMLRWSLPAH